MRMNGSIGRTSQAEVLRITTGMIRHILLFIFALVTAESFVLNAPIRVHPQSVPLRSPTELALIRRTIKRIFRRKKRGSDSENVDDFLDNVKDQPQQPLEPMLVDTTPNERASVCVVGGGVSGLSAAISCAKGLSKVDESQIVLLEASPTVGGRVQSDKTQDGYTLDRGFAVFIEAYPESQKLLDYDKLHLGQFLPGALVKISKYRSELARISDPLRVPADLFTALTAPIGNILDKLAVTMLILNVRRKSIDQLFQEKETSTLEALEERWGFSETMMDRFFRPFLEGVYLAPLDKQSSRMFSFVMKMFSEGSAYLPEGGIGAVSEQLKEKALESGVDIRVDSPVVKVNAVKAQQNGLISVETMDGKRLECDSLIIATEGIAASRLISQLEGFESLESLPKQPQRAVGCVYYGFKGEPPVSDPILILNGIGADRGSESNPINNICFPSVVARGYAPEGYSLCSVSVRKETMDLFRGRDEDLDEAVRKELASWFPNASVCEEWDLKGIYRIPNAQPSQFRGPLPANVHSVRPANTFWKTELPDGIFVCGDHMSTATLNGALESGTKAGVMASMKVAKRGS